MKMSAKVAPLTQPPKPFSGKEILERPGVYKRITTSTGRPLISEDKARFVALPEELGVLFIHENGGVAKAYEDHFDVNALFVEVDESISVTFQN